jgi:glycosyltransferase involved in cell wall biosynthesis
LISYSISKRSILLVHKLKRLNPDFDWVIAHNPGAFYPAFLYAKKNSLKLGIDIEDYHPGESIFDKLNYRMKVLMKKILLEADYCSFASPLIEKEVKNEIIAEIKKSILILNGFSEFEFKYNETKSGKLKLVWYSQNINFGRGLEKLIPIMSEYEDSIHLTLIGNLNSKFSDQFNLKYFCNLEVVNPLSQLDLHNILSEFDVGLALETGSNRNNQIAISNKIISYVQSGLYIVAFKTLAQQEFIIENKLEGEIIENDPESIRIVLNKLIHLKKLNKLGRNKQYKLGKKFSWQIISSQLIKTWKNC